MKKEPPAHILRGRIRDVVRLADEPRQTKILRRAVLGLRTHVFAPVAVLVVSIGLLISWTYLEHKHNG